MNKLPMRTPDLSAEKFAKLEELFPNAVTETIVGYEKDEKGEDILHKPIIERAVDPEILQQEINTRVLSDKEVRYQFTWPDKRKSVVLANAPINATLRPCREESVNFDTTENLYIEGDNLEVLKLLRETYLGRVKMIYIDPPYNTGKNYIYKNDFINDLDEYISNSGQYDADGNRLVANLETNGQFHTDWLNMIYPRLKIAKQLLTGDGVLVVAIDENEQATVSMILKEIFREGGYEQVCVSVVHNPGGTQGGNFSFTHEYAIFVYPKTQVRMIQLQDRTDNPDIRPLRDVSTGNHLRTDARNCFYPIFVDGGEIVGFGEVSDDSYHPQSANVIRDDGITEVYPIDANGNERKWVWARHTVENIRHELRVVQNNKRGIIDIERVKTQFNYKTVWIDDKYNANSYGSKLLAKLMPNCGFSFPKSVYTVLECVRAVTLNDPNAIVLDFFSGSATTAHAVMQLNSDIGGQRKFIAVQLPENLDTSLQESTGENKKSLEQSIKFLDSLSKPHRLTEIGKERIRRAGRKIVDESPLDRANLDIGFRVLKLDSSNMKDVYYTPDKIAELIINDKGETLIDNIKEDRTAEDLLFQVMLDLGVPLSAKLEVRNICGADVHFVEYGDGYLIACFGKVNEEIVTQIAKEKPYYAVFRDGGFESDSAFVNAEQIFKTYSPDTERSVL